MKISNQLRPQPPQTLAGFVSPRPAWVRRTVFIAIGIYAFVTGFFFALSPAVFTLVLALPIAFLALLAVWALPDTERPPLALMRRGFFVYLVLLICWPYYLAFQAPGLPLIEPRRIAAFIVFGAFVISLSVSPSVRAVLKADIARLRWFFGFLAVYFAAQVWTLPISTAPMDSFAGLLNDAIYDCGMLFVAALVFGRDVSRRTFISALIAITTALCILAYFESRSEQILWANSIPSFLTVNSATTQEVLDPNFRNGHYRVTTTFSVSLSFAEYLSLVMPFLLYQVLFGKSLTFRVSCAVLDVIAWIVIGLTQARVGLVGATAGHAVFGVFWAFAEARRRPNDLLGPTLIAGAVSGMIALGCALMFVPAVYIRLLGGGATAASNEGRADQLAKSLDLIWGQGLVGFGLNRAGLALNYTNPNGVLSIDLGYLRVLLDLGVIGLIAFVGLLVAAFEASSRLALTRTDKIGRYAFPAAAVIAVFIVSRLVLAQTDNFSLTFMVMGLIVALTRPDDGLPPLLKGEAAKADLTIR